jgi:hypothetical protein
MHFKSQYLKHSIFEELECEHIKAETGMKRINETGVCPGLVSQCT